MSNQIFKQMGINLTELSEIYHLSENQCNSIIDYVNDSDNVKDETFTIMLGKSPFDYEDGNEMLSDICEKLMCFHIKYSKSLDKKTLNNLRELIINLI